MKSQLKSLIVNLLLALVMVACSGQLGTLVAANSQGAGGDTEHYELATGLSNGKMVFIGIGGDIAGVENPTLRANIGDRVEIALINGEGNNHSIVFPDFKVESAHAAGLGSSVSVAFTADKIGEFNYSSNPPGESKNDMQGKFVVVDPAVVATQTAVASAAASSASSLSPAASPTPTPEVIAIDVARDPSDLPGPLEPGGPTHRRIDLEAQEVIGTLADGTTFTYWTFNGKVPGPFLRVRLGDTVEVHMKNSTSSSMSHSVDFHAVTGPGGGAVGTQTNPGEETMFTFQALNPGLFVYHCATPIVAEHIANGMYGLILVEPEGGLPRVGREFYVMQGEIYTTGQFGMTGMQMPDVNKLLNETPDYYVLNGTTTALTTEHPLQAHTGETIRIFFGVGGPNKTSSFHIIGEIFDKVYDWASLTSAPLTDVQTTSVPPGGATVVELKLQVPGRFILVDHALSRMQRGLAGYLVVEGDPAPEIFSATPMPGSGH
jgi:nitrite reductase (NO-forming)